MSRMSTTVGHFANLPSHGCVVYFEKPLVESPEIVTALVAALIEGLALDDLQISTKWGRLQWSKYAPQKVSAAISGDARALTFLVGSPSEVHLAARIWLRADPSTDPKWLEPPHAWFAAEGTRWPADRFTAVVRAWFRIIASDGAPLSGGAFASDNMRNAKAEASLEYDSFYLEPRDERLEHLKKEPAPVHAWEKVRRIYPLTLLGPTFAARTSADALRDAGAAVVEKVGKSLIVYATPTLVETWSKPYSKQPRGCAHWRGLGCSSTRSTIRSGSVSVDRRREVLASLHPLERRMR